MVRRIALWLVARSWIPAAISLVAFGALATAQTAPQAGTQADGPAAARPVALAANVGSNAASLSAAQGNRPGATIAGPPQQIVHGGLSLPAPMPIPAHLGSTTDAPTCAQHGGFGGGLACDALLSQGQLALIWSFKPNQNPVTGFHIYRVDGGAHDLASTQPNGAAVTVALLPAPPAGACYAVAAYNGVGEGKTSGQFCPGAQSVLCQMNAPANGLSMTLCPQAMMTWSPPGPGQTSTLSVGGSTGDAISQGLLLFDVPAFDSNRTQLLSAQLKMRVARSDVGSAIGASDVHRDTSTSCAAYVFENTSVWWPPPYVTAPAPASGPISAGTGPSAPDPKNVQQPGPAVSFDVTNIVNDWFGRGIFNFGFVLYGQSMPFGGGQSSGPAYCTTTYDPNSVVLVLQFY